MKKTLVIIILLAFSIVNLFSQEIEIEAEPNQIEVIEIVEDYEEIEIEDDQPVKEVLEVKYLLDKKYDTKKINEQFVYYYNKNDNYSNRRYGILKDGKKILPDIFKIGYGTLKGNTLILTINKLKGLYNLDTEEWDIPIVYSDLSSLKNNLFRAYKNGRYAIIDSKNNKITDFTWTEISVLYGVDNYVKVTKREGKLYKRGIYNYVSKEYAIPCEYQAINTVNNTNLFKVKKNSLYNIVDINNNLIFKNWYETIVKPSKGRNLYVVKKDNKMGVIDEKENAVVPIEYKSIKTHPYSDGSYLAENKEGKFGCITIDGRVTLPFIYNNIEVKNNSNGNVLAIKDSKCGIVRVNDGMPYELTTCDYDSVVTQAKYFIVEKNNKYGLLNLYGKPLTEMKYDKIVTISTDYSSKNKLIKAIINESYYLLDNTGKQLNDTEYTMIKKLSKYAVSYYTISYLVVKNKKNKAGLVDIYGKEAIPMIFDDILFKTDENYIFIKNKNKVGVYSIYKNKLIIPADYDQILPANNYYIGIKDNKYFKIDLKNEIVVKEL